MVKETADSEGGPWHKVKVFAPVGYQFGIVHNDGGVLELVIKAPGEANWPHGLCPAGGENEILEGHRSYVVMMG